MFRQLQISLLLTLMVLIVSCDNSSSTDEYEKYRIQNVIPNDLTSDYIYEYAAAKIDNENKRTYILLTNTPEIIADFDGSSSEDYLLIEVETTGSGIFQMNTTASLTLLQEGIYYYSQSGTINIQDRENDAKVLNATFNSYAMSYQTTAYLNIFASNIQANLLNDSEFGYNGKSTSDGDFDDNFVKFTMRLNGKLFDDRVFYFKSVEICTPVYTENDELLNIYIKGQSESLITATNVQVFINLKTKPEPGTFSLNPSGFNTMQLTGGEEAFNFDFGDFEIITFENKVGGILEAKFSGDMKDPYTNEYITVENGYMKVKITG